MKFYEVASYFRFLQIIQFASFLYYKRVALALLVLHSKLDDMYLSKQIAMLWHWTLTFIRQ